MGYPNSHSRSALALPALLTRRLSQALSSSDGAIASHGFMRSTLSCCCSRQGDKKNNTLQFLLGCLCLTHSAEHCCPHLEHLFPLWSLLLWGIPLTTSSSASKLKSLEGFVKWEMMGGRTESCRETKLRQCPIKPGCPQNDSRNWGQMQSPFLTQAAPQKCPKPHPDILFQDDYSTGCISTNLIVHTVIRLS